MIPRKKLVFVVLCGCLCLGVSRVRADDGKTERQVTVQGHGKVSAVPDQARLWVEVTEEGSQVAAVTQEVRTKIDAVIKTLKAQGIAEKDIQTQAYQVTPKMEWHNGRSSRVGYTASNRVEVKVHDLKKTGTVLAAVLDAGANNINGPTFEFENPQDLERKALGLALQDAKAKAALLAQEAGSSLGEAIRIEEGTSYRPGPRPMRAMQEKAALAYSAEEPIAAGEDNVEATITASFALK